VSKRLKTVFSGSGVSVIDDGPSFYFSQHIGDNVWLGAGTTGAEAEEMTVLVADAHFGFLVHLARNVFGHKRKIRPLA
jgi:hypothetical protein